MGAHSLCFSRSRRLLFLYVACMNTVEFRQFVRLRGGSPNSSPNSQQKVNHAPSTVHIKLVRASLGTQEDAKEAIGRMLSSGFGRLDGKIGVDHRPLYRQTGELCDMSESKVTPSRLFSIRSREFNSLRRIYSLKSSRWTGSSHLNSAPSTKWIHTFK